MVYAELDRTTIVIDMSGSSQQFVATGEVVRFDGFLRLYSNPRTTTRPPKAAKGCSPKMAQGDELLSTQITATERFTQAPARYNEASLVKRLEELGIGRPSTYAPTITTIINRGYVVKQNREGQKTQLRANDFLTGDKLATKTSRKATARRRTAFRRRTSAWSSTTTSKRSSSRSWTITSRPASKRNSTASPTATSRG